MATSSTNPQLRGEKEDSSWVRQSLFVPLRIPGGEKVNARERPMPVGSQFSYSTLAFADTSLGGNRSINPKPQFTKFADPNLPSLLAKANTFGNPSPTQTMGMGRYYAEAIDQNAQRIFLQFGVPAYNSLTNFFTTFYDPSHSNMANSGAVSNGLLYTIGKYIGYITFWTSMPMLSLSSLIYDAAKKTVAFFQHRPLSKFYYMKPTMPLYWSTVTTIVNAIAVNMKLVQGVGMSEASRASLEDKSGATEAGNSLVIKAQTDTADMVALSKILPDIYLNDKGGIDIRAVANRYQRLADAHERALNKIRDSVSTDEQAAKEITAYLQSANRTADVKPISTVNEYMIRYAQSTSGLGSYLLDSLADLVGTVTGKNVPDSVVSDAMAANNANKQAAGAMTNQTPGLWAGLGQHLTEYADYAVAELRDGSAFVSFIVEYESHVGETFSSSTRESDIASRMNETARSARGRVFDFANGNVGDGAVANAIEAMVGGVKDIISGIADAAHFSGLAMLSGKAFVDIPEFWDASSTSLPNSTYDIHFRSPYGNPISILSNVLIPTAMLIAGAAPRSAGRNAYTGPFLCKLWQKGRTQIQLGMITSLSITRGTGNTGWNLQQQPIGIDVSVTITNLSKILHVPITTDISAADQLGLTLFDEDTTFTDYMAVLGSLGLSEQYYASSKWRLRRARFEQDFSSYLSVNNFLTWGADTIPGSIMSLFARQANLGGY